MKPPNNNTSTNDTLPAVALAPAVLQTDAKKRNIDIDVQCTKKNKNNCLKNLPKIRDNLVFGRGSLSY